jgi:acyl-homoserine-lactone acylase
MKKIFLVLMLLPLKHWAQPFTSTEINRWKQQAKNVTIVRDNFGVPHIYGKKDADAVFGLMYAQCEDDFGRVEMNYIEKLGRMAELKGESALYHDLLNRMLLDSADAVNDYNMAPAWLKLLCNSFANGINYYIYKNPENRPQLISRFKPWYPMLWTDGSIGAISIADIEEEEFQHFYSGKAELAAHKNVDEEMLTGSNGFAFSPKITKSRHSILYINPHVTFYFRPEVHMVSEEGLNAYGAVTWGQFFVYQGFNEHCGWMHTSSGVDAADTYIEKLSMKNNSWLYEYEHKLKPITQKKITIRYRLKDAGLSTKTITALYTHHGPIMAKRNGQVLSMRADNRLMNGLVQCWQRTKAAGFAAFKKTLDLRGNISNNTVYADAEGNIAYWHGNRIPARDKKYDWTKPVDGAIKETEWKGLHNIDETVQSINPVNGWLQNCNSTPFTVAGNNSPQPESYPAYMAPDPENFRGINAVRVLGEQNNYTIEKVIAAGYDSRLTAFELLIPGLVLAFEKNRSDTLYSDFEEAISILKNWDYQCAENSIATTLAVEWGYKVLPLINRINIPDNNHAGLVEKTKQFVATAPASDMLEALRKTQEELTGKFGTWKIPWGDINRFQRISPSPDNVFSDEQESIPVPYVSSLWGMLPSYTSRSFPDTKKLYGVHGNSFICVVEFGKRIKAKSLLAGGQSGNIKSPHFFDQGRMYSKGLFKDVLFYKEDVMEHAEMNYHPGDRVLNF